MDLMFAGPAFRPAPEHPPKANVIADPEQNLRCHDGEHTMTVTHGHPGFPGRNEPANAFDRVTHYQHDYSTDINL
jgi:hypothetical protein